MGRDREPFHPIEARSRVEALLAQSVAVILTVFKEERVIDRQRLLFNVEAFRGCPVDDAVLR